jgi:hypothetical protein
MIIKLPGVVLIVIICVISACGSSVVKSKLSGVDSVVIQYYFPGTDSISKTITTNQEAAIRKLVGFTASRETENFKCGYDGNMIFYKDSQLALPIVFKYREKSCRHFLMDIDGKIISTKLSGEAADFFTSLDEGKSYY